MSEPKEGKNMITREVQLTVRDIRRSVRLLTYSIFDRRELLAVFVLAVCLLFLSLFQPDNNASAQTTFPDPNANCPRATCGEVSPFIPMQSTEAVHMGLVWKRSSQTPKLLYHARFPEYEPNDIADPALIDRAIMRGALTTAGNQSNSSRRAVPHT